MDEVEIWKCTSHPSTHHRAGICPTCLRNRLLELCPNCATLLPCPSCPTPSSSVGRLCNLIDGEPPFRRSRSLMIPFLRSSSRFTDQKSTSPATKKSFFKMKNSKNKNEDVTSSKQGDDYATPTIMERSRSVGVKTPAVTKGRGWFFPSPIFRQTKTSKVVQERSPLHKS